MNTRTTIVLPRALSAAIHFLLYTLYFILYTSFVNKPHAKEEGASDDDEWEFLSGATESTSSISLGVSYRSIGSYFLNAEYTRSWIKNVGHELGVERAVAVRRSRPLLFALPRLKDSSKRQILLEAEYRF